MSRRPTFLDVFSGVEPYSTWTCRCPDGPRYAALGNAVAVPCVRWIGERLLEAHRHAQHEA